MLRRLLFILALFFVVVFMGMGTTYAHTRLPVTTSCNTLPNNADCNGQPTPGGCATDEILQPGSVGVTDTAGHQLGYATDNFSSHCGSNWPLGVAQYSGATCQNIVQRQSGPDGPALTYYSVTYMSAYPGYDGSLVYARQEFARIAIVCWDASDGNIHHQSLWTDWW